jgi:23S rRNA (uracil1939-C5)-methyltransferase
MLVDCKYKEICSGCRHLGVPLDVQHEVKAAHLRGLLNATGLSFLGPLPVISPGPAGLRDRVDLIFDRGRLGLYEKTTRDIVDIETCPQLSPALQAWLTEARRLSWPVQKGSLRLRVGPQGLRGIWLDFANVDIKKILDEKIWLQHLQELAFVEIGQRHKVPVLVDEAYKLRDPSPQIWFQTWSAGEAVELFCSVANFTQPSLVANRALVKLIDTWLVNSGSKHILEFGSGIGNLSFAALGHDRHLTACEIDERALEGFRKSLEVLSLKPGFAGLQSRVEILRGDFQSKNPQDFGQFDTVLVNPPRSGLKQFLEPLLKVASGNESGKASLPRNFIYMSCYPQSFVEDGLNLQQAGYKISELTILDQFPQTDHYEILSLWTHASENSLN